MLNPAQLLGGAGGSKPQRSAGAAGAQPGGGSAGQIKSPGGAGPASRAQQSDPSMAGEKVISGQRGAETRSAAANQQNEIPEELKLSKDDGQKEDSKSIGHEDFLKLMMTQLKNQDPTDPQDTEQMMGQIAQFTTASGINQLQEDFQKFFEHMRSDQSLRAAQLVGREVLTESGKGHLPKGGNFEAILQLDSSAPNLTVEIANEHGELVHSEQLGQVSKGEHPYVWDGTNANGKRLPEGQYQVQAYVEDGENRETVNTLVGSEVTSVSMGMNGRPPELSVAGLGDISLAEIKRIR